MAVRPAVAEPLFWASLLVGLIGFPLYLAGDGQGAEAMGVLLASAYLLGLAAFGFGSALLLSAYSGGGLHPASILAAALGALGTGLLTVLIAADLAGGLRIFAFSVLVVAGMGMAAAPRAWHHARDDRLGVTCGGKTGQDAGPEGP